VAYPDPKIVGGGADEPGQHDSPASMQIYTLNDANQLLRRHAE
jgi:hypothetical protein